MRSALLVLAAAFVVLLVVALRDDSGSTHDPLRSEVAVVQPRSDAAREDSDGPARELIGPATEPDSLWPAVRVIVTFGDGAPAAAATVRYYPARTAGASTSGTSPGAVHDECADLEATLRALGEVAVADEHGVAMIAVARGSTVCARLGDVYGEAAAKPDEREVRIALQPDIPLRVQVVDADGRPREGFDVEVEVSAESRRDGKRFDKKRLLPTDADGMTVLSHAQQWLAIPGADVFGWRMVLRCDVGNDVERTVTADELMTGGVLRITVPAGGTIAFDVVDADGGEMWSFVTVEEAGTGESRGPDRRGDVDWFRQLPLARQWTLRASSHELEVQQTVAGPTQVDQVVRAHIELPLRSFTLKGRLVRADGVPVPRARFWLRGQPLRLLHDSAESRDSSIGGRIGDFDIRGALPADVGTVEGASLHGESREPYCGAWTIALAHPLHPGENDIGDVVVPVPADEVLLAAVSVRHAGRDVTATAWAFLQTGTDRHANWLTVFAHHDKDRISFHGRTSERQLIVGCSHAGCVMRREPIQLGEHRIVELESAASLTLRVLWPPVPPSVVTTQLLDADGNNAGAHRSIAGLEWRDLAPGRHTLRILVDGSVVHEVPALDLVVGANVWPPDGTWLDLRTTARAFHLDIRDSEGGLIERPRTFAVPSDRAAPPDDLDSHSFKTAENRWFVPQAMPVDVVVTADGFVPVRMAQPSADCQVRLERCTTLRVVPAAGHGVRTAVRIATDAVRDPWLQALDANPHDPVTVDAQDDAVEIPYAPGTVVEVVVERAGVPGTPQHVTIGTSGPIEIRAQ